MSTSILWLVVGGVLLYLGAEALIRGAVSLAFRAGMTPLVVGLTVVAAGTSMPELIVSVLSATRGQGAIAIGNVIGSNVCNVLLIAGIAAIIRPVLVQRTIVQREIPLMIGASLLAAGLLWSGQSLGRLEAGTLFALLLASTTWSIRSARRERLATDAAAAGVHPAGSAAVPAARGAATPEGPAPSRSVAASLGLVTAGLVLLVAGADRFVSGAVELARVFGLSEAVIGLTVVAVGTSLPELATSVLAALKGESDMALGNVVGSNMFNLLGILGVTGLVQPIALPAGAGIDLVIMVLVAMLVLPLSKTGLRLHRWEGAALVGMYAAYTGWLLVR